jgi:hypothetical protein
MRKRLSEDLNLALQEPSSNAAEQAQKMGLQYVGFGRYEDPNTQQVTHIVQNDRLVPFNRAIKTNSFKQQSQDDYGAFVKQMMPDIQNTQAVLIDQYKPEMFTPEELDAIESFTGQKYTEVNDVLLSLPSGIKADKIQPEFDGDDNPSIISALDSALNKTRTPVEFFTYVGLGSDYNVADFLPGTVFSMKGFRSTTINPNVALNTNSRVSKTSNRQQTVLLQIKVKENSRGLFVEDFSSTPGESEFILPRGSKIKVLSGPSKLVGSNKFTGNNNLEVLYFTCETANK